jgi:hypothetical protein
MNLEGKYLAVWLHDEAAKLFLGLPQSTTESRWAVLGMGVSEGESLHGLWLEVDTLQERKGPDANVARNWRVRPPVCLIKWEWIITIQVLGEEIDKLPQFGFRPA